MATAAVSPCPGKRTRGCATTTSAARPTGPESHVHSGRPKATRMARPAISEAAQISPAAARIANIAGGYSGTGGRDATFFIDVMDNVPLAAGCRLDVLPSGFSALGIQRAIDPEDRRWPVAHDLLRPLRALRLLRPLRPLPPLRVPQPAVLLGPVGAGCGEVGADDDVVVAAVVERAPPLATRGDRLERVVVAAAADELDDVGKVGAVERILADRVGRDARVLDVTG